MESYRPAGGPARVVAVLGPTNTGKTHLAIERMLAHRSGMIGFPLRLLARENYDRIVRLKGASSVALITGEERIVPAAPRWFVCTVEAMPLDHEVAFLAVDEIQMIADRERGHVFTDRLLHARGHEETMFLGAATARPVIRRLVRGVEFVERARLSTLSWAGPRKITRLPRRSAVVAFSAADVTRIAELVRRQRGGAAVVFGALSPRTRNAQVAMYQAGEVDWLVATDAIGMGLNMDIGHVAFAELTKFDGRHPRRLAAAELAQIAGRAGRHMADGSFGTTAEIGPLEPAVIDAIENHRFPPLGAAFWRNADLDLRSPAALLASLEARPPDPMLIRARHADDHRVLQALARDGDVAMLADRPGRVRLLWDCCQIPDFRKTLDEAHARLVKRVFLFVAGPAARLPAEWIARQVERLDRTEGDIDSLLQRIAHVRTWTYVANRAGWLDDPESWQARTRAIEDKLSDALHERLTQRFVDRRSAAVGRRLADGGELLAGVRESGEVVVEGERVGAIEGFAFRPDPGVGEEGGRALLAAANRAVRQDVGVRVGRLARAADDAFAIDGDGALVWEGHALARLAAGPEILSPRVELLPSELLEPPHREAVRRRLVAWLDLHLARVLAPLWRLRAAELAGPARGLAFELVAALGCLPARRVAALVDALSPVDRRALASLGAIAGDAAVFVPALRDRRSVALRALLWRVFAGAPAGPLPDMISAPRDPQRPPGLAAAALMLPAGPLDVRADRLERLAREARKRAAQGIFAPDPNWAALIGCAPASLAGVLEGLGYRRVEGGDPDALNFAAPRRERRRRNKLQARAADPHSPFAGLRRLIKP